MTKEKLYKELLSKLKTYMSKKEIDEIKEGYLFAQEKHKNQLRKTGEEYIIHPLNVSIILTTIKADKETIIAGLLHDVLEDTDTTKEEIKEKFGEVVLKLVDGVTKINSLNISTENEYLTSYYKKIIVGMSEDVRVIIIKLADRLHNMRTLDALTIPKQKRKARETLEILAPIAHRLGMSKIKGELEDLSLKYLKPDAYNSILEQLKTDAVEREKTVKDMMDEVSMLLNGIGINHEIKGRAKSIYSIYRKLDKGKSFNEIYDILAIRILVEKEQECYLALGIIHSKFKPVPKRFKDYIAMPKTNLYQTLHTTVFGKFGNLFEIQIRTYDMDDVAENGIASHWAYKEGKNAAVEMQNITEQKLQFYKSIIELKQEKLTNEEFVNSVKNEVLSNNIYVYTPKGDVFELPYGSTPLDFAYKIHSEVGNKTSGAIVNDCIVPLSYKLNNSDIVKITTNKNQVGPSREWLNIVKTTQAKNKIKSFFNKTSKEEQIAYGKESLEKELRRQKISITEFLSKENIEQKLKELKLETLDDLYLNIGNGKYSSKYVIKSEDIEEKVIPVPTIKVLSKTNENDIIVGEQDSIKTHIANCCLPIPGDNIVGYITKTNGISIHRRRCPNVKEEDRIINASFISNIKNKYYSKIIIESNTSTNLITDIVQTCSNASVFVENISVISKSNNLVYSTLVSIKDKEELESLINSLSHIKHITSVYRDLSV